MDEVCIRYLVNMGAVSYTHLPIFFIFYLRIFAVDQKGTKSVTIKITGNEKLHAV